MPVDEILALSMRADAAQLNEIAHNLANVNTAGYKRRLHSTFQMEVTSPDQPLPQAPVDTSQGALKPTGNPFDLALKGPGYMVIDTPHGRQYTRRGSLAADASGTLTLVSGQVVVGESGPIRLDPGPFKIALDGSVSQGDKLIGKLSVVEFETPESLSYLGNGMFASPTQGVKPAAETHVQQGFVEASNVNSLQEIQTLVTTVRHFESVGQVYRGLDSILDASINELAKF